MALEYLILKNEPNGLNTRYIQAYARDTAISPQVRLIEAIIPIGAGPGSLDLQALWQSGTIIPGGAKLWNQIELRDADENNRDVINAILDVVRANGTLAQMIAAGEAALADNPKQQTAYNRLLTALNNAPNNTQRWQLLGLLATVTFAKIGQK
jgi:hypothetical protein